MKAELLYDSLLRLAPHVDIARIAVTGGVAVGIHVDVTDNAGRSAAAEDIDFVVEDVDALRATVATDFLVSHFHLPHPGYAKFMIQLVDPLTRLRLDFFPDSQRALTRSRVVQLGGTPLRVFEAGDLLGHKIALLSNASPASPADAKHYDDARRLGTLLGRTVPPVRSSHLAKPVYSVDIDATCVRCDASRRPDFPLAPKEAIFGILRYV